jgi:hypothetical protein
MPLTFAGASLIIVGITLVVVARRKFARHDQPTAHLARKSTEARQMISLTSAYFSADSLIVVLRLMPEVDLMFPSPDFEQGWRRALSIVFQWKR